MKSSSRWPGKMLLRTIGGYLARTLLYYSSQYCNWTRYAVYLVDSVFKELGSKVLSY